MNVLAAVSIAIASTNILWKTVDITCGKSIDMITSVVTKPVHGFNDLDEMLIEYDITCRLKHIRLLFKTLESKTYVETQSELINECLKELINLKFIKNPCTLEHGDSDYPIVMFS